MSSYSYLFIITVVLAFGGCTTSFDRSVDTDESAQDKDSEQTTVSDSGTGIDSMIDSDTDTDLHTDSTADTESASDTQTESPKDSKDVTRFTLLGIDGAIGENTVTLAVPHGTDLTSLTPTITHTGLSIDPPSGVANDFTSAVEYTVTAEDDSTKVYTVTVTVETYYYNRSIVINHEKVGTDNNYALPATGFPVLISLSGDWLKTTGVDEINGRIESSSGHDIVFRDSDGTTDLYHEIESYDGNNGKLVVWVRIDSLSKSDDTTIYIFYGNPLVSAPTEYPNEVWDLNYRGIWHLTENGAGAAKEFEDSSGSGHHGRGGDGDAGKTPTQATGEDAKIGAAQSFDGVDDFIGLGNPSELDFGTGDWAISCWSKIATLVDSSSTVYAKGDDQDGGVRYRLSNWNDEAETAALITDDDLTKYYAHSTTKTSDGKWHFLVGLRAGNELKIYVDGVEEATQTISGGYDLSGTSQRNAYIGALMNNITDTLSKHASGVIDEVRVSGAARSADWITTSYNNQNDTAIGEDKFIKSLGVEN